MATSATSSTPPSKPPSVGDLRKERKRLWNEREESVYHVGGLAVDLRRRGIDDTDLVHKRADAVLEIDQRLNELDSELSVRDRRGRRGVPLAAGYCISCGAPFQHDAAFCFRCGSRVAHPSDDVSATADGGDQPTAVLDDSESTLS